MTTSLYASHTFKCVLVLVRMQRRPGGSSRRPPRPEHVLVSCLFSFCSQNPFHIQASRPDVPPHPPPSIAAVTQTAPAPPHPRPPQEPLPPHSSPKPNQQIPRFQLTLKFSDSAPSKTRKTHSASNSARRQSSARASAASAARTGRPGCPGPGRGWCILARSTSSRGPRGPIGVSGVLLIGGGGGGDVMEERVGGRAEKRREGREKRREGREKGMRVRGGKGRCGVGLGQGGLGRRSISGADRILREKILIMPQHAVRRRDHRYAFLTLVAGYAVPHLPPFFASCPAVSSTDICSFSPSYLAPPLALPFTCTSPTPSPFHALHFIATRNSLPPPSTRTTPPNKTSTHITTPRRPRSRLRRRIRQLFLQRRFNLLKQRARLGIGRGDLGGFP